MTGRGCTANCGCAASGGGKKEGGGRGFSSSSSSSAISVSCAASSASCACNDARSSSVSVVRGCCCCSAAAAAFASAVSTASRSLGVPPVSDGAALESADEFAMSLKLMAWEVYLARGSEGGEQGRYKSREEKGRKKWDEIYLELKLLHLESLLEDLSGLLSADGDVNGDLLVSADSEGSHSVAGCKDRISVEEKKM